MNKFQIGYFADGIWSHNALKKILKDETISIEFVCARFDRPDEELRKICIANNIEFLVEKDINSDSFYSKVKSLGLDLLVSMSFNQIFKSRLIDLPKHGTINCHAGKLPFYRGRNVLNWVLINDEKEFGISVHYIDEGIDTGDLILQESFEISENDNYKTILEIAYKKCAELLYLAINKIQHFEVIRIPQNSIHPTGFYCSIRKPGDEEIDWNKSSREIFNFVRALCTPGPQATTKLLDKTISINRATLIEGAPVYKGIPGSVLGKTKLGLLVKTGDTFVEISEFNFQGVINIGDRLI